MLEVPEGSFTNAAEGGPHLTRVLRYLALDDELAKRSADGEINWGEEHTDMNLVTVLPGGAFYEMEPGGALKDGKRWLPSMEERSWRVAPSPPATHLGYTSAVAGA